MKLGWDGGLEMGLAWSVAMGLIMPYKIHISKMMQQQAAVMQNDHAYREA